MGQSAELGARYDHGFVGPGEVGGVSLGTRSETSQEEQEDWGDGGGSQHLLLPF